MVKDGLIKIDRRKIQVLEPGRLLIRAICMVFDGYLDGQTAKQANVKKTSKNETKIRYSQVI